MSSLLEIVPGTAVGVGVGGAVTAVIGPRLQNLANEQWSQHQDLPLDAATAAAANAEGLTGEGANAGEASLTGVNSGRFGTLVEMARTAPDTGTLLELWRRGFIDEGQVDGALRKNRLQDGWHGPLKSLRDVLLPPADLAMARQQGFIDVARQHDESLKQGVSTDRADILFEMSGLPPGVETGLEMLRRSIIGQDEFAQIVREGHTKTKYTNVILELQRRILSAEQAAAALVKEHISHAEAVAIAEQNGISAADFETMYLTAGRPAAPGEMLTLINRGFATQADFERAIAQSDIRPEYAALLIHLRDHYPSLFQLRQIVQSGGIDDATAIEWLHFQGYNGDVATKLLAAWKQGKSATAKDLQMSTIETMYEARYIDSGEATALLKKLGYDDNEITMILELGDARRVKRFLDNAVGKIRTLYNTYRISQQRAITDLDALGISSKARDDLVQFWTLERDINVPRMTVAQIQKAIHSGAITEAEGEQLLLDQGFPVDKAHILAASA